MKLLAKLDGSLSVTRPLWGWLGQVALVILGTHLAADRLDDALGRALSQIPVAWPHPQSPFTSGTWLAIGLEFLVTTWAIQTLAKVSDASVSNAKEWASRWSIHNIVGPLFWLPVSLAGSWTIAMAVEDLIPLRHGAHWIGITVGLLVAWRLSGTGFLKLLLHPRIPKRRMEGWAWVLPLACVGWFATRHGLPIWGWR